ncbi:hypothetical protein [Sphingobacterium faecium]|uniref:4'-phosphopantetheinyl transferase family protein n=1 Tax=Sphingobacterium faecium TaxID=34087 RepID=UPI00320797F0
MQTLEFGEMVRVAVADIKDFEYLNIIEIYESYRYYIQDYDHIYKYKNIRDRILGALGKILVFKSLENINTPLLKISKDAKGKPFFENVSNNLFLSISHAKDKVVVAVSTFELGIDIEYINKIDFRDIKNILPNDVAISILKNENWMKTFHVEWSKRESLYKCNNKLLSISTELSNKQYLYLCNKCYYFNEIFIDDQYSCSIVLDLTSDKENNFRAIEVNSLACI